MFKKSIKAPQLNIFSSPSSQLTGRSLTLFEDKNSWHKLFYQQVTVKIDEEIFKVLFCENNGTPNASIRVLVGMMVMKEATGVSDEQIFENCRFNLLFREALGLFNITDPVPAPSTYYSFRQKIVEYSRLKGENLLDIAFSKLTQLQSQELKVSGKSIRMDSKLLGSNIAWLSRYELIHETLRLFYAQVNTTSKIEPLLRDRLNESLKLEGSKVVYTSSSEEVKSRLQELGVLIYKLLPLFSGSKLPHYETLKKVFEEQYVVDEHKLVVGRENKDITARSIQSPHDTDSDYRDKDGNKVKGYSINIT